MSVTRSPASSGFFNPQTTQTPYRQFCLDNLRKEMKEYNGELIQKVENLVNTKNLDKIKEIIADIFANHFQRSTSWPYFIGGIISFLETGDHLFTRYINFSNNPTLQKYVFQLARDYYKSKSYAVTKFDEWHFTLYHWACMLDQVDFLNTSDVKAIDPNLMTDLHVRHWPDLPLLNIRALHLAAQVGARKSINFLLDNGADIELFAYTNQSAITFAARFNQLDAFKLLLKRGAKLVSDAYTGYFMDRSENPHPLIIAAKFDFVEIASLCITDHLDQLTPETIDHATQTALHHGNVNILRILLPEYLKLKLYNDWGHDHPPSIDKLFRIFRFTHKKDAYQCIQVMLENGADPNIKLNTIYGYQVPEYEPYVLWHCIKNMRKDCVELLLTQGAKPDYKENNDNKNPLLWLATKPEYYGDNEGERLDIMKLLVSFGADIKSTDNYTKKSVLEMARESGFSKMEAYIEEQLELLNNLPSFNR